MLSFMTLGALRPLRVITSHLRHRHRVDLQQSHQQRLLLHPRALQVLLSGSSMANDEGDNGLPSRLWRSSRKQAVLALYHPFVVSLAAGALPINSFRHYIAQDAFFLQAFADAYNHALANVDDESSRLLIHQLRQSVLDELKLHSSFLQGWGVDLNKESKPNNATVKYTDFLLATATCNENSKTHVADARALPNRRNLAALTIGAMTPCMRLYAFLGHEISKCLCYKHNGLPYREWVGTYASEAFQGSTSKIEELLNQLAQSLDEDDVKHLNKLYSEAMDLEVEFFSAQPNCDCEAVPVFKKPASNFCFLLASDFDSTCSTTDSCPALVDASIEAAIKQEEQAVLANMPYKTSVERRKNWDTLKMLYNDQYASLLSAFLPCDPERDPKHFDYDGLKVFLGHLSQFEIKSNQNVVEAGVLQGLDLHDVRKVGSKMLLQEGCGEFFAKVATNCSNVATHIISVCWSTTFIDSALSSGGVHAVKIHANELKESSSVTSGDIDRRIETPLDKERVFENLLEDFGEAHPSSPVVSVYIGDSITDMLCLLKSNLGIVVGSSSSLQKVARAFGVKLVPLYQGVLERQMSMAESERGWKKSNGVLYTVSDWHEIYACLVGKCQMTSSSI